MMEQNSKPYRPRDTKAADEAMDRLHERGFTAFRNGRIVTPKAHAVTDEERADFEIVKSVYRHSTLI